MVPAEIRRRFDDSRDVIALVASRVRDVVRNFCDDHGYAYIGRPKTLESVAEKIETGRFGSWSALDDLFACAVVIPTIRHEGEVLNYLENEFVRDSLKRRGQVQQDPEIFRFGATRFVGKLKPTSIDDPKISSICFEVQIRTAFEHAWSVTTHDLAYKGGSVNWQLDRLAAQLKASVEQLDYLVSSYEQAAAGLIEHPYQPLKHQQQILEFFRKNVDSRRVPLEVAPDRWSRFAKNVYSLIMEKMEHSTEFRNLYHDQKISRVLEVCEAEINQNGCPRSLSLFQFVLGVLVQRRIITPNVRGRNSYSLLVTAGLEELFPETRRITSRFDLDR